VTVEARVRPSPWSAALRTGILIAVVVAIVYFLTLIPKTVEVFIVATLIAYGINPLLYRLKRRMPRPAAIALVYVCLVVLVVIVCVIVVPDTVAQLQNFFQNGTDYITSAQHAAANLQQYVTQKFGPRLLPPQLQDIEGRLAGEAGSVFSTALYGAGNFVLGFANVLIIGITSVVLSYFLLTHADEIRTSFFSLFPDRSLDKARLFTHEVGRAVGGFIFGQIVLCLFCGIATAAVLAMSGSQYALLLGTATGLLYAIPYLGIFVALVLGFALGTLQGWTMAIVTVVVIFVITRIADLVLVPKVMADSVGISPMAIIFAVFAGGELFGVWGLVLAIPAAAIFKVAWRVWLHPWLTGKPALTYDARAVAPPTVVPEPSATSSPVR
jgi:predicted PurR-regulated permease PerM